jgi:hypothetical protein
MASDSIWLQTREDSVDDYSRETAFDSPVSKAITKRLVAINFIF